MPKNNRVAVGIDLGGTSIKAGLISETNGLIKEVSVETRAEEGPERVLDRIAYLITSFLVDEGGVVGVGIGAPGAINLDRTTVSGPPNFPGWTSSTWVIRWLNALGNPFLL